MLLKYFDVQYVVQGNEAYVYFFCRDSNRKRYIININYQPYFYTSDKDVMLLPIDEATKVLVNVPSEVAIEREKYAFVYEPDILFPLRYIIDRELKNSMIEIVDNKICATDEIIDVPPRIWTLDIEVLFSTQPDPYLSKTPIVCITVHDSYTDEYISYTGDEEDILNTLLEDMKEQEPDVISGWNVSYDATYIIRRMQKLNMNWRSLSPINIVQCDEKEVKIHGIQLFDLQKVYVRFKNKKFGSENLTYISRVEEKITDAPLDTDYRYFSKHLDEFLELNKSHVRYCVEIDNKYNLTGMREKLRSYICGRYYETEYIGRTLDLLLLRKYHGTYVARRKPQNLEKKTYKGAFVLQPVAGMYTNVIVLDYSAMYPSFIISYNMSPETLTDSDENVFNIDGIKFKKEPIGVLPELIKEMLDMRSIVQEKMKEATMNWRELWAEQYAYKSIIASIYGAFASRYFRFYEPKIAEAITYMGRKTIKYTIDLIKRKGFNVVVSDTDSTYVELGDISNPIEIAEQLTNEINEELKTISEKEGTVPMNIKFEKIYNKFITTDKKKRYAGMVTWEEGHDTHKLDVKGLEYKRSNAPQITKEIQEKILTMLLEGHKDEVHDYLLDIEDKIREYPLEQLGIPMKLQRQIEKYATNYQTALRGVKWCEENLEMHFKLFERFYLIYIKKPFPKIIMHGKVHDVDRVAFNNNNSLPDDLKDRIDYKLIVDKIVNKKVKDILGAVGMLADPKQNQLDGWF